jgi:hypothetical protein
VRVRVHVHLWWLEYTFRISGGDWSIHRGASVFADGAVNISVSSCVFDQVDGNGIFFSRYVRNSTISNNDFTRIGDSAILVVGASGKLTIFTCASFLSFFIESLRRSPGYLFASYEFKLLAST